MSEEKKHRWENDLEYKHEPFLVSKTLVEADGDAALLRIEKRRHTNHVHYTRLHKKRGNKVEWWLFIGNACNVFNTKREGLLRLHSRTLGESNIIYYFKIIPLEGLPQTCDPRVASSFPSTAPYINK